MKYIAILFNWRIVALTILAVIAFVLIACDCEDFGMFILTKLLGVALAYGCWRLSERWDAAGLLKELAVFNDDGDMEV